MRNGRFWDHGPPGGDEENLGPQAPEAENGRFLNGILIRNLRFGDQGAPGGDEEDLGPEAPEAENGRFSIKINILIHMGVCTCACLCARVFVCV